MIHFGKLQKKNLATDKLNACSFVQTFFCVFPE